VFCGSSEVGKREVEWVFEPELYLVEILWEMSTIQERELISKKNV
jgi:hypothetical protein